MAENLPVDADRTVPDEYVGDGIDPNYYCRGWNAKRKKYCRARAGSGTDHLGQGRCRFHRGTREITHGRYSKIEREELREAIERFQADPDPLNVLPELAMLRGIMEGFVNRYDELVEALFDWNIAYASGDDAVKPQRIPELREVAGILDTVSKIVSRIEKARSDSAISRKDLFRIIGEFGRIVDARVQDDDVKEQIKDDWLRVSLA